MSLIRYIDLFAGMGGMHLGFERACKHLGFEPKCVFISEIKPSAVQVLKTNFDCDDVLHGDIRLTKADIPEFDVLLGGFPCQAFSSAGKRRGFGDDRGTLFFEVESILREKKPKAFLLENVEGLVVHNRGRTFELILNRLKALGYQVTYSVLNSADFGVAQSRKRVYICGTFGEGIDLSHESCSRTCLADILERTVDGVIETDKISPFIQKLLSKYSVKELEGKRITDKRGGNSCIHSWDVGYFGNICDDSVKFLNQFLCERRKSKYRTEKTQHTDGIPMRKEDIRAFYNSMGLACSFDDVFAEVLNCGYIKQTDKPGFEGCYDIRTGALSLPLTQVLSLSKPAPALVATDLKQLYVPDGAVIRPLTEVERKRLFGFPDDFPMPVSERQKCDLLGNTVVIPVIDFVSQCILKTIR